MFSTLPRFFAGKIRLYEISFSGPKLLPNHSAGECILAIGFGDPK
jgi:hypothetical protein